MTSNDKSSIPWTKGNVGDSNLIRTSSLDPDYKRQNLNLINTPVKLLFEKDVNSITLDWSQDEVMNERRLVQFNFNRISPTDFWVEFNPIAKKNYTPEIPIISCIYWKEKDIHIVTSVDIILILEYLVQESFSIEEKNRIRRNLQSLKPYTISRTNASLQRFFNLLMSMEDPRPRNIEKDLKVFKWSDLFVALNKVILKYSSNIHSYNSAPKTTPHYNSNSTSPMLNHHNRKLSDPGSSDILSLTCPPKNNSSIHHSQFNNLSNPNLSILGINGGSINKNRRYSADLTCSPNKQFNNHLYAKDDIITNPNHFQPPPKHHQSLPPSSATPSFLPYERLKVLKRRMNQSNNSNQLSINNRNNRIFQHALKPADPVPLNTNTSNNNTPNGGGSSSATITDESNSSPDDLDKISNDRDSNDSSANELSNEKSGFAAVAAEQKKSPNNDSELASAPESTEILELNSTQGTPNSNDENATGSRSNGDSGGASLSGSGISGSGSGSGSSGSNFMSSNTGLSSNVFSSNDQNSSTQPSSNTSGGNSAGSYIRHGALNKIQNQVPPSHPPQQIKELDEGVNKNSIETNKDSDNVKNFTKDQSHRMFGSSKTEDPTPVIHPNQYYQYPTQSQLYHSKNVKGNNTPPLSKKNVEIHDAELQHQPPVNSRAARLSRLETTAQPPPPIQSSDPLPSLKDNIDNINSFDNRHQKKESGIQLPPITPSFQSNFPLPSVKQVAGYLMNADGSNLFPISKNIKQPNPEEDKT